MRALQRGPGLGVGVGVGPTGSQSEVGVGVGALPGNLYFDDKGQGLHFNTK